MAEREDDKPVEPEEEGSTEAVEEVPDAEDKPVERIGKGARKVNQAPSLVRAAKTAREILPGDPGVGDSLSTAENKPSDLLARYLAEQKEEPSTARELGLAAIQVFQAFSEARGAGRGEKDLAILFTDLVGFSDWALEVGDATAVELLRAVADAVEPAIKAHSGKVVKRLGDGYMAVFTDAESAVDAALDAQDELAKISIEGHTTELRAGVHLGQPRKVGGDYLGVDVNIAARVADAAGGGQVLVSEPIRDRLDDQRFKAKQRRRFRAKGAPRDMDVFAVSRKS